MATPSGFRFSSRAHPIGLVEGVPPVYGYAWRHPSPVASIVLVHGLQSHAGWFAEAADGLVERGLSVYALERRGSGSSPYPSGDIDRYGTWFAEVERMVDLARAEQPGVPVHLLGHCFGAGVALGAALQRPDGLASLVLVAPGLHVLPRYRPAEQAAIAAAAVAAPARRFRVPQDDGLFSADPDVVAWIAADSLGARSVTARCLVETRRMMRRVRRRLGELRLPLLVVEAGRDRISDNAANAALFDRRLPGRWRRLRFDGEHFLLAEACRDDVLDAVAAWIGERPPVPRGRRAAGGVRVATVEVRTLELPLRFSFGHALAERRSTTNVCVKVTLTDGTVGYGEGVPRDYVTGETPEAAADAAACRYGPALLDAGGELAGPADVAAVLDRVLATAGGDGPPGAAWCAVELAVLDAAGRCFDRPVSAWLGPVRAPTLTYDAVLPLSTPAALVGCAAALRALHITRVKLKVGRHIDDDVARVRLLRRLLGPALDLRVDANCAWTADEALAAIARLRPFGVSLVEQPVAADDIDGLARITAACPELIAVDESLRTVAEARALVDAKACDAFNVRVSKCGGLRASMRIAEVAADAGLSVIVGAQVGETGLLSSAGRHLAACVAPRYLEGSAGRLLLSEDITAERILPGRGGAARPHGGAGLGVTVRPDVLDRHTTATRRVRS